jgi:hypothetical protein
MTAPAASEPRRGVAFWVAVVIGIGLIAVGISTMVDRGVSTILNVGVVTVASDLAHDLVLLPVVAVLALALRRVPPVARAPIGAALGWTLVVMIVAVPLIGAYGRTPNNPSVLPLDYATAIPTALGIGWVLCALWLGLRVTAQARVSRRGRRGRRADGSRTSC